MPTITIEVKAKRPRDATPEKALHLVEAGMKMVELAKLWGISRARVSQLVKRARIARAISHK